MKDLELNNSQLKNKLNDFTKTKEILERQLNDLDTVKLQLECDLINTRQLLENKKNQDPEERNETKKKKKN